MELRWSWLAAPYLVCAAAIAGVTLTTALTRGDRVMRLGVIGAGTCALPWALCQALAAATDDAQLATTALKVGLGPASLVGPCLLLVLLGASGQLERYRWVARIAGLVGLVFMVIALSTSWVVPSVQKLSSGMYFLAVGKLTGLHVSQIVIWLVIGYALAGRGSPRKERRRTTAIVLVVLVFGAIAAGVDSLVLYGIWGSYPTAWLPASLGAMVAAFLVLRTDLIRPQGFDRDVAIELGAFLLAGVATAGLALAIGTESPLALTAAAAAVWTAVTAAAWGFLRSRPVKVSDERALDQFVSRATRGDEKKLAERLHELWKRSIGIDLKTLWTRDGAELGEVGGSGRWKLGPDVLAWLGAHADAFGAGELATTRLGDLRGSVEAMFEAHGATLLVPLVDRAELVGLAEAHYELALRVEERRLVVESARASARGLTFFALARAASKERAIAREVEVADALRLQAASASRDAEFAKWAVGGEYRSAPRTTGAGWSAVELSDGRLAILVTEAQAHGVAAALATAALTGAFAAATAGPATVSLDELLSVLHTSSEGVMRGGEPVAAFVALLDAPGKSIEWAAAGHPGALLVGPIAIVEHGLPEGSAKRRRPDALALGAGVRGPAATLEVALRGRAELAPDTLLVVASSALRGEQDEAWQSLVRDAAPSGGRLATTLVEGALATGEPREDLLAVVVRAR